MKNQNIFTYDNVQDSIPKATAGTGTISNANNNLIIGVGTEFLTEAKIGDYIYIKAQNDFRLIENIVSDTELVISTAFGSALSGASYDITPTPIYTQVKIMAVTGAPDIDGFALANGKELEFSKQEHGIGADYVLPIDVNCTSSRVATVTVVN